MSYAIAGFGAADSFALQWKDVANTPQSAAVNAKGPVCGYQIASQVMLGDLGYGAGKSNTIDPAFNDAFHQYALARKIEHAAGAPVSDAMCGSLLADWQAIAAPSAANKNLWEKTTAAPKPVPGAAPADITSQLKLPPVASAAGGSWWSQQTQQTKMLVLGGGAAALLLAVLVNLPKGGK